MAGSHIFAMYTDGSGNVTISGRKGTGHQEPQEDSSLNLTLMEGSGIVGDNMIANVLCSSCASLLDSTTDLDSNWIGAWKTGTSINSKDTDTRLAEHGDDERSQFTFDLSQAGISSDSNPFLSFSSNSSGGTAAGGSRPDMGVQSPKGSFEQIPTYQKAHGVMMGLVVVVLFPLGALFMPVLGAYFAQRALIHGSLQLFSLIIFIAAIGLGVHLADLTHQSFSNVHTRFGIAILMLFLLQPIGGIIHHLRFRQGAVSKHRKLATGHRWLGRATIGFAVINGGLGLKLADNTMGGKIAYGVIAGLMALLYVALVLWVSIFRPTEESERGKEEPNAFAMKPVDSHPNTPK